METPSDAHQRAIVVGVDGSPSSVAALQLAMSLVPLAGDVVYAVAAWHHPVALSVYTPLDWNYEEVAGKALDQALIDAFPEGIPAVVDRRIRQGNAAKVLIDESERASMVVVGSRGHGGFAGLLLGSVSSTVAERAHCPVLVSHGGLETATAGSGTLPGVGASAGQVN